MRYIFFLIFLSSSLIAQEVLSPLKSNPREKKSDFLKNKASLSLPFFDDFSSLNIKGFVKYQHALHGDTLLSSRSFWNIV